MVEHLPWPWMVRRFWGRSRGRSPIFGGFLPGATLQSVKCRHGHDLCPKKNKKTTNILPKKHNKNGTCHVRPIFFFQKHIRLLFLEVRPKTSTQKSHQNRGAGDPPDGFCGGMSMRNKRSSARASVEFKRSSAALPPIEDGLEGGLSWEMVEIC